MRHHRLPAPHKPINEVYQSSTINALLERVYDGDMTCLAIDDNSNFHIELSTDGAFLAAKLGGDRAGEIRKSGNSNKESHQDPTRLTGGESRDPVS